MVILVIFQLGKRILIVILGLHKPLLRHARGIIRLSCGEHKVVHLDAVQRLVATVGTLLEL